MREKKFRAFGKIDNQMHYFNLTDAQSEWVVPDQEISDIMQYTGLKDKNGKEIYEGDIIQNVSNEGKRLSIFEIRWQQSSCGFVKDREDGNTFTLEISKYFEVIGNIYEHKHLIP